jgi:hypothetical protein
MSDAAEITSDSGQEPYPRAEELDYPDNSVAVASTVDGRLRFYDDDSCPSEAWIRADESDVVFDVSDVN